MKKLLTILLVLISFSTFAQFEAGEYINSDTVKINGVPLLLNTFKKDSLGGAGNIFYSTGASSQPASGSVNQVVGNNYIQNQNDSAQVANMWISGLLSVTQSSTIQPRGIISENNVNGLNSGTFLARKSRGTPAQKLAVTSGNSIGNMSFSGYDGVEYKDHQGIIQVWATEDFVHNSNYGTELSFELMPKASGYLINKVARFTGEGNAYIMGTIEHENAINEKDGVNLRQLNAKIGEHGLQQATNVNFRTTTPLESNAYMNVFRNGSNSVGEGGYFGLISKTTVDQNLIQLNSDIGVDIWNYVESRGSFLKTFNLTKNGTLTIPENLISKTLNSTVPTGTPPLVVASSTKVDSLNVGLFDGKKASDFQLKSDTLTFDATLSDLADSSAAIRSLANTKAVVSGTDNYIMKKTGANTLGNSNLRQSSTTGGIGIGIEPNRTLHLALNGQPTFALSDTRGGTDQQEMGFLYDAGFALTRPGMVYQKLGNDGSFRQNLFTLFQNGTINFDGIAYPDSNTVVFGAKKIGAGTLTPAAQIHSQSAGTQARLGYDATKYTDLTTGSTGNFTIDPTGDTTKFVGAVNSTGGFFENGVKITGGGGGMVYPPAGLAKSTGTGWATSITDNSIKWDSTYNKIVTSVAITGSTVKTILLNRKDGTQLSGSFTDMGADWRTDSFGANYGGGTGKIGAGTVSKSDCWISGGNLLGYNIVGVRGESSLNAGVLGRSSDYTGVYGTSTNSYGIYGESANNYGGWFEGIGVNIRTGNLDVNSQTRITSGGFFQPVSSTDAAAPNNSIYYSTTQSKLVYKNASGTVNVLY